MTPRVAVLISTYNGEVFLAEQLESLAAQEGVEVDVFVRDDGSSDGTLALLRRYSGRWPALAAPMHGPNLGPADSFLALLAATPAGYDGYAFCDQDDVWLSDKLSRALSALQTLPAGQPGLYCTQVTCVAEDLTPLGAPPVNDDGRFEHILFENIAYGCTSVMNRAARDLVTSRMPEQGVAMHDWWCALVVAAIGKVIYDREPRVLYRQHGRNAMGAMPSRWAECVRIARVVMRAPHRYYPIHGQAREFQRLFGGRLRPDQRRLLDTFVASKRSLWSRLRYAATGVINRRLPTSVVLARALVVMGWY